MRKTILTGALALGALLGTARPAHADCVSDAVAECDKDFGGANNFQLIAIRGWCYIIRSDICWLME